MWSMGLFWQIVIHSRKHRGQYEFHCFSSCLLYRWTGFNMSLFNWSCHSPLRRDHFKDHSCMSHKLCWKFAWLAKELTAFQKHVNIETNERGWKKEKSLNSVDYSILWIGVAPFQAGQKGGLFGSRKGASGPLCTRCVCLCAINKDICCIYWHHGV